MAAFVPAKRGLSWQLSDPNGAAVVRERYWLSFHAGEIRSCTSCHGVNATDQAGRTVSVNPPQALRTLLDSWKQSHPEAAAGSFRIWSEAAHGTTLDPNADNDSDGVSNFEEYATGSPPLTASPAGTRAAPLTVARQTIAGQAVTALTFARSASAYELAMTVEYSDDMSSWNEAAHVGPATRRYHAAFDAVSTPTNGGQTEEFHLTDYSAESGRRFYRLRMEVP
jgi:hypothetical protein